jgi:transposase
VRVPSPSTVLLDNVWAERECHTWRERRRLDERIETVSTEIEALALQDDSCQRLMTVPGVGPIISSAKVAAIGNGAGFKRGHDFSAWLRLVTKQESTGDRTILGKISKRGNKYARTLFVQAAHVVLVRRPSTAMRGLWPWIEQASKRLHRNMRAIVRGPWPAPFKF